MSDTTAFSDDTGELVDLLLATLEGTEPLLGQLAGSL